MGDSKGGVMDKKLGTNDVVLQINSSTNYQDAFFTTSQHGNPKASNSPKNSQSGSLPKGSNLEPSELENLRLGVQTSTNVATFPDSGEIAAKPSPAPSFSSNKPPKIPAEAKSTSDFSKPKSRLAEPPYAKDAIPKAVIKTQLGNPRSQKDPLKSSVPSTPKTPLKEVAGPEEDEEDDDEEVHKTASPKMSKTKGKKWKVGPLMVIAFVCITGLLIASLTIDRLKNCMIWDLELWKWSTLVLVIFSGRLFTERFVDAVVDLIRKNFLRNSKGFYFLHGLRKSAKVFIWLALILIAWVLLLRHRVKRSRHATRVLNHVTKALAGFLVGAGLWLLKTFLVKLVASNFHVNKFFDKIQESIFNQFVLKTLSGLPLMEIAANSGGSKTMPGKRYEEIKKDVNLVDKLRQRGPGKISASVMKGLMRGITDSGFTTLWDTPEQCDGGEDEQKEEEIRSERQARDAAYRIFNNVAKRDSEHIEEEDLLRFMKKEDVDNVIPLFPEAEETRKIKRHIEEEDLLRFMKKEDVDNVIPLFPGAEKTRKIEQSMLKNWLLKVYKERKSLSISLNDTKTAIEELNRLASAVVLIISIIVWLLIMGYLTTNVLVFISSQLLLVAFMFGNTAKMVFEAIIFVFVTHPFDVGDRCVIDGVQMVVEEMNLLTTIFLRYDNEMIYYPNSVLATKPISNFRRSPEMMSDAVEFAIDVSTSVETIEDMKASITEYLRSKRQHWYGDCNLQVKEIENVDKMRMALYVTHTINFQNAGKRGKRRSNLVLALKKIFEKHGIKYRLLPQEVQVSYAGPTAVPPLAR